jgi:maleylpyruvate isomerase
VKLVLHNYWRSSASHRVRIALGLKKLKYEYRAVNIVKDEQLADGYKAHNAMAQVPTLEIVEDDGASWYFTQSLPIIEYLDERWPEPFILPGLDPMMTVGPGTDRRIAFSRARARALAEIVNSGIQPHQNLSTTRKLKSLGIDDQAWPRPYIATGLAAFEALVIDTWAALGHGPRSILFSAGDVPTVADCCLIPQLASARRFGVDYAKHEVLVAIEKRCLELDAFKNAAPENQPDAVKS